MAIEQHRKSISIAAFPFTFLFLLASKGDRRESFAHTIHTVHPVHTVHTVLLGISLFVQGDRSPGVLHLQTGSYKGVVEGGLLRIPRIP